MLPLLAVTRAAVLDHAGGDRTRARRAWRDLVAEMPYPTQRRVLVADAEDQMMFGDWMPPEQSRLAPRRRY
jgi:hypothetical protein